MRIRGAQYLYAPLLTKSDESQDWKDLQRIFGSS